MRSLILALAVVLITFSTPARADDRDDASREFQAGAAADKDKDYRNAIDHYRRAFDILPHQFAAFNIATDYEKLNDIKNAVIWYQKFLTLDSTSADAQKVKTHLNDLSQRSGPVAIDSTPQGARVLVDGQPSGSTPLTVQVKGGSHRITLEQDGRHQDKVVTTEYGIPAKVSFSLQGANGTLIVYGTPAGATVYIDDQPAGSLPFQAPLPSGEHTLRVQSVGFTEVSQNVTVPANAVARLPVHLVRGTGPGADGTPGAADPNAGPAYGYLIGVSGGADVANAGANFTFDFGVRVFSFDGAILIGKTDGSTSVGFLARYSLSKKKVQPFIGVGYFIYSDSGSTVSDGTGSDISSSTTGSGPGAQFGFRWDLSRNATSNIAVRATAGLQYIADTNGNGQAVVPITLSIEAIIGKQVAR